MEYQIALPPDLDLSPADFVTAWNAESRTRTIAEARLTSSGSKQYDPSLADGALALLSTISIGVATNAIYDLIKQMLVKHGVKKHTQITQIDRPDGTHVLVVVVDEEQ
jgi:hypothetical protein